MELLVRATSQRYFYLDLQRGVLDRETPVGSVGACIGDPFEGTGTWTRQWHHNSVCFLTFSEGMWILGGMLV